MTRVWAALLVLFGSAGPLLAAGDALPDYAPPAWPHAPGAGELLGRLGLLTALVVGCAGVALWLARRARRLPPGDGRAGPMHVVASLPLDARCSLHLLQVDQSCFVIATDATGLRAAHPLADFEEAVAGQLAVSSQKVEDGGAAASLPPADDVGAARLAAPEPSPGRLPGPT